MYPRNKKLLLSFSFRVLIKPPSVDRARQELLDLLTAVRGLPGKTGDLAEEVAKHLQPHLDREGECALPLLGLLRDLASERLTLSEAQQASKLYELLKEEYPQMTRDHRDLFALTGQLKKAGMEEGHPTAVSLAETLEKHVEDEVEILYPAALLAGKLASQWAAGKPPTWIRTTTGTDR